MGNPGDALEEMGGVRPTGIPPGGATGLQIPAAPVAPPPTSAPILPGPPQQVAYRVLGVGAGTSAGVAAPTSLLIDPRSVAQKILDEGERLSDRGVFSNNFERFQERLPGILEIPSDTPLWKKNEYIKQMVLNFLNAGTDGREFLENFNICVTDLASLISEQCVPEKSDDELGRWFFEDDFRRPQRTKSLLIGMLCIMTLFRCNEERIFFRKTRLSPVSRDLVSGLSNATYKEYFRESLLYEQFGYLLKKLRVSQKEGEFYFNSAGLTPTQVAERFALIERMKPAVYEAQAELMFLIAKYIDQKDSLQAAMSSLSSRLISPGPVPSSSVMPPPVFGSAPSVVAPPRSGPVTSPGVISLELKGRGMYACVRVPPGVASGRVPNVVFSPIHQQRGSSITTRELCNATPVAGAWDVSVRVNATLLDIKFEKICPGDVFFLGQNFDEFAASMGGIDEAKALMHEIEGHFDNRQGSIFMRALYEDVKKILDFRKYSVKADQQEAGKDYLGLLEQINHATIIGKEYATHIIALSLIYANLMEEAFVHIQQEHKRKGLMVTSLPSLTESENNLHKWVRDNHHLDKITKFFDDFYITDSDTEARDTVLMYVILCYAAWNNLIQYSDKSGLLASLAQKAAARVPAATPPVTSRPVITPAPTILSSSPFVGAARVGAGAGAGAGAGVPRRVAGPSTGFSVGGFGAGASRPVAGPSTGFSVGGFGAGASRPVAGPSTGFSVGGFGAGVPRPVAGPSTGSSVGGFGGSTTIEDTLAELKRAIENPRETFFQHPRLDILEDVRDDFEANFALMASLIEREINEKFPGALDALSLSFYNPIRGERKAPLEVINIHELRRKIPQFVDPSLNANVLKVWHGTLSREFRKEAKRFARIHRAGGSDRDKLLVVVREFERRLLCGKGFYTATPKLAKVYAAGGLGRYERDSVLLECHISIQEGVSIGWQENHNGFMNRTGIVSRLVHKMVSDLQTGYRNLGCDREFNEFCKRAGVMGSRNEWTLDQLSNYLVSIIVRNHSNIAGLAFSTFQEGEPCFMYYPPVHGSRDIDTQIKIPGCMYPNERDRLKRF